MVVGILVKRYRYAIGGMERGVRGDMRLLNVVWRLQNNIGYRILKNCCCGSGNASNKDGDYVTLQKGVYLTLFEKWDK